MSLSSLEYLLIHDYFGVDYDIVWDVVVNKVPSLRREIEQIVQEGQTDI